MEIRFDHQLARRLRGLRKAADLTLDELAARSGVGRSTISLAERAETSPTANSLDRLAAALGVPMAALFTSGDGKDAAPVVRMADQGTWRDPVSGYLRRTLTPPGVLNRINLAEIELPPGADVILDNPSRPIRIDQQVWVLLGTVEVRSGDESHRLDAGDCLAMDLDRPSSFRNLGHGTARYLVATAAGPPSPTPVRANQPAMAGAEQRASRNDG